MLQLTAALRMLTDRLATRDEGGVVIEYGIIVAVIALGLVAVGTGLVGAVGAWFTDIAATVGGLPDGS